MAQDQIRSVQGTEDVLPGEWGRWRALYDTARRLFGRYGYGEIRTPILEDTRLFAKGTGETTDIVQKQMYTIPAGDGESIALRPEGTPAVVRSYLDHNLHKQEPFQKFFYAGPMFRRERPQKGRLRQFHQLGVEAIGSDSPLLDAETITLAVDIFRELGLRDFRVYINSIGCAQCRPRLRGEIRARLEGRIDELCDDCRARLERNVFRVLDCKNEQCIRVVAELPPMAESLGPECATHYSAVKAALQRSAVPFEEDPHLVRGLDYYTRTVYEIKHGGLGARDTICGGGRYDGLVELLGGPPMPCVGFALGVEATILAMESEGVPASDTTSRPAVYVVSFAEEARANCLELVQELRRAGIAADMDFQGRSPKAQMRAAGRVGAPVCLLLGPDELRRKEVTVKIMESGEQETVPRADAISKVLASAMANKAEPAAGQAELVE